MDKIAIGEESGKYEEAHARNVTEEPFHVYISGIDVYGDIKKESRSDVNLIATVNPKTHKILLTTTPRDYYVPIPGVSDGQRDKLTHAGIYGIDTSIATLEELYDIDIPFYVRVNFTSVEEIVDVMGGVDVESELAFTTGEEAGAIVEVKQGKNHFTGKEALAFVRERKALAEEIIREEKSAGTSYRADSKHHVTEDIDSRQWHDQQRGRKCRYEHVRKADESVDSYAA